MPKIDRHDPKLQRRNKIITQLEQPGSLAFDPNFVVPRQQRVQLHAFNFALTNGVDALPFLRLGGPERGGNA